MKKKLCKKKWKYQNRRNNKKIEIKKYNNIMIK